MDIDNGNHFAPKLCLANNWPIVKNDSCALKMNTIEVIVINWCLQNMFTFYPLLIEDEEKALNEPD